MGNFNRGGGFRDRKDFGRRSFGRSSDRPMFKAICSRCGSECELPFRPTGERPVFCSKCFETEGPSDSRRSNFDNKRMYEAVCDNCGEKCSVPFQPSSGKPVYCSKCFGNKNDKGGGNCEECQKQFEAVSAKLDQILKILSPEPVKAPAKEVPTEIAPKEKVKKVVKKVASKKKKE